MAVIGVKSITGITSITNAAGGSDLLTFHSNNTTERFRIGTGGQIGLSGANYGSSGQVLTSQGSGSAVAWSTITGTTINNNANNRIITGSGTANTLEGESTLTYDGTNLDLDNGKKIRLGDNADLVLESNGTNSFIDENGSGKLIIRSGNQIEFTSSSNASMLEMFVGGAVKLFHGNATPAKFETTSTGIDVAGDARLSNSGGNAKLKIKRSNTASNTDDYGSILFQSSADNNNVAIGAARQSAENDAYLFFSTASGGTLTEKLRINKDGNVAINSAGTATNLLDVRKDATSVKTHVGTINGQLGSMPNSSEYGISLVGGNGEFQLHKDGSGNYQLVLGTYQGSIDMPLVFRTDNRQERMRIAKAGHIIIGGHHTAPIQTYSNSNTTLSVYDTDSGGGTLELASNNYGNAYNAGMIIFANNNNANQTAWQANSKLVGMIRAETVTSDNNAGDDSGADIAVYVKPEATAGNKHFYFRSGGNFEIADGDLKVASGHGIDFSAVAGDLTNMSGELLDDYEEGYYVPTCTNSVTLDAYGNRLWYTKIGNQVTVSGSLKVSSSNSGQQTELSLPYTAAGGGRGSSSHIGSFNPNDWSTEPNYWGNDHHAWCEATGTTIKMRVRQDNGDWHYFYTSDNMYLGINITYTTAS